jgi:hypothetical protein
MKQTAQQQILEDFAKDWESRVGSKYYINWAKDSKFANQLIEMSLTPDEYTSRKKMFFSQDRWWEFGRWGFATFVNNINSFVTLTKKKTFESTTECLYCKKQIPKSQLYNHQTEGVCPEFRYAPKEVVDEAMVAMKGLFEAMDARTEKEKRGRRND